MPAPVEPPLGLHVARVAKVVSTEFDAVLSAAGGSLPAWLVLLAVRTRGADNQQALADAIGIHGATLTHHLNAMEARGLISRRRDPANRRNHLVEVTADGEALFRALRRAATTFDARLRGDLSESELHSLRRVLDQLADNLGQP